MKHSQETVNLTLQQLGKKALAKRGGRGIREVASEIGISPATLSRIERGHLPDIGTFRKVCTWLGADPGEVLGSRPRTAQPPMAAVHFRKDQTLAPQTAQALAQLILAVQRNVMASETSDSE